MNIYEIEEMKEIEVKAIATEEMQIKGHNVYFVNIDGAFGYSVIVYANDHQIKYANDYQLHHSGKTIEELKEMYINGLNNKLYTDDEIAEPIKDYSQYEAKRKFIMELIPLQYDHLSMFHIVKGDDSEYKNEVKKYPFPCYCAFSNFKSEEPGNRVIKLLETLSKREKELKTSYQYWFDAFYYELGNHEYHINTYQGDWDTLSAFGNIEWHGQGAEARSMYFKELGFNETQIKAFEDARAKFLKAADENDWY